MAWAPSSLATDLSGRWQASAMVVQWRIGQWEDACGPKPGVDAAPAGVVSVEQRGRELVFSGAGATFSSGQCWERRPGVSRVSHSAGANQWTTTCKSQANATEEITIKTTISATEHRIHFDETGRYRFSVNGHSCTASSRKSRSFELLESAAPASAHLMEAAEEPAASSGAAASKPGTARAAAGRVRSSAPTSGAPQNTEPASIDSSLLDDSALGEAAEAGLPTSGGRVVGAATVLGPNTAQKRKRSFLLISTFLALVLGGLGVFQLRRAGALAVGSGAPRGDGPAPDGPSGAGRRRCPRCGEIYSSTQQFCGKDGSSLVDVV